MRTERLLIAMFAILPYQAGCDLEAYLDSDRYREDFQYSYNLRPGGTVAVENFNGPVEILSWEKDSVQITGTKHAATESDLKDMKIDASVTDNAIRIRTIRPDSHRGNMGAKYFIRVPRNVLLERIASSNGGIRVEDISGNARLETSNGSVRVRKMEGRLDVRTSNGAIEGEDVTGDSQLRTTNGAIRLTRITGAVDATTSNGGINVRRAALAAGRMARLQTSNGGIEIDLESLEGNDLRAATSNASITLRLPMSARAHLNAHTSHGNIHSDFDVEARRSSDEKHTLVGDIGGGGRTIELVTSNGAIHILKM